MRNEEEALLQSAAVVGSFRFRFGVQHNGKYTLVKAGILYDFQGRVSELQQSS